MGFFDFLRLRTSSPSDAYVRAPSLTAVPSASGEETEDVSTGTAAIVDLQTTGIYPDTGQIIELAIVLFAFDRRARRITGIIDEYVGLRDPTTGIRREMRDVHGITKDMVRGKSLDEDKIATILARAEFLIAHDAAWDYGFLREMFDVVDSKKWLCSKSGIGWARRGFKSNELGSLLEATGQTAPEAHRSGPEARGLFTLLGQSAKGGRPYLAELLESQPIAARTIETIYRPYSSSGDWIGVRGESQKNRDGSDRQKIIAGLKVGDRATLVREPNNPYDRNAIAVYVSAGQIGYVPREDAEVHAPDMDDGATATARVVKINGGTPDAPSLGVVIEVDWESK